MGFEIARSADAGIRIAVIAVLKPKALSFAKSALDARLNPVLVIMDPQWQPSREIILGKIGCGKGITGDQIGLVIERIIGVEQSRIDISHIRGDRRFAVE